jgi:structural maintenance of chromosome 2
LAPQLEIGLRRRRKEHEVDIGAFAGIKESYDTSTTELAKAEELLQTLLTGLSASSNGEGEAAGGYMGQLAEAKSRLALAGTEEEQAKVALTINEKELKEKEPRANKAAKDGEGGLQRLSKEKDRLKAITAKITQANWDDKIEYDLEAKRADLENKIADLGEVSSRFSIVTTLPDIDATA